MNEDSTYTEMIHVDTNIDGRHTIIDTIIKQDTLIIEKVTFDKEIQIIEKLINRPDFGKSAVSILIMIFVVVSVWKKWNCKPQK